MPLTADDSDLNLHFGEVLQPFPPDSSSKRMGVPSAAVPGAKPGSRWASSYSLLTDGFDFQKQMVTHFSFLNNCILHRQISLLPLFSTSLSDE